MRISGYNEYERFTAIKGAIDRVDQMKRDIKNGLRDTLHRDGGTIRQSKRDRKDWSNTWFLKGEVTNILKIPCTPNSKLVNLMRERAGAARGPDGGLTKFVEMGGLPILPLCPVLFQCFVQWQVALLHPVGR